MLNNNPTASLIGFILKYAEKDTAIYKLACELSKEAYDYFKNNVPLESMHESACFVELYEYMKECSICNLLDMKEFKRLLQFRKQRYMWFWMPIYFKYSK